jgi:membrane protein DedA with SNARE-associated domain
MGVALLALLSCAVWNLIWILMGYMLGTNWEIFETRITAVLTRYNIIVLVVFVLVIIFFVVRKKDRKES